MHTLNSVYCLIFAVIHSSALPLASPASVPVLALQMLSQGLSISCRTLHSPQSNIRRAVGNIPVIRHQTFMVAVLGGAIDKTSYDELGAKMPL